MKNTRLLFPVYNYVMRYTSRLLVYDAYQAYMCLLSISDNNNENLTLNDLTHDLTLFWIVLK